MELPKAKKINKIRIDSFIQLAKEARKSLDEELKYIYEKRINNGHSISEPIK